MIKKANELLKQAELLEVVKRTALSDALYEHSAGVNVSNSLLIVSEPESCQVPVKVRVFGKFELTYKFDRRTKSGGGFRYALEQDESAEQAKKYAQKRRTVYRRDAELIG